LDFAVSLVYLVAAMILPIQKLQDFSSVFLESLKLVQKDLKLEETENPTGSYFVYDSQGLTFYDQELGQLHLDFLNSLDYVRKSHRGKSELIAKAVGLAKGTQKVFDATVGLAQDAWFLAQLGAQIEGCERSPVVFLLLADALERAGGKNLQIFYGDSIQWLKDHSSKYQAIYIDPMFPEKKKSALPRKEMRIFKKWVGEDLDAIELLKVALESRAERVIVKRPLRAEQLSAGVVHSFEGQTVRYDLYSPPRDKD